MSSILSVVDLSLRGATLSEALPQAITELGIAHLLLIADAAAINSGTARRIGGFVPETVWLTVFPGASDEPSPDAIRSAAELFRLEECDGVVAFGGARVLAMAQQIALSVMQADREESPRDGAAADKHVRKPLPILTFNLLEASRHSRNGR